MHANLKAATIIFEPEQLSGWNLLIYDLASAVAMWFSVAVAIALIGRPPISHVNSAKADTP